MEVSEDYIIANKNNLPLETIVRTQKLSIKTLYMIYNDVDLNVILNYQVLNMDFIKNVILRNTDKKTRREENIDIDDICNAQNLTIEQKNELICFCANNNIYL